MSALPYTCPDFGVVVWTVAQDVAEVAIDGVLTGVRWEVDLCDDDGRAHMRVCSELLDASDRGDVAHALDVVLRDRGLP
jgi:hypothetical protein